MGSFSDQIKVTIDVVTNKAKAGLDNFRKSVGEAEGSVGKLKAGASSLASTFTSAASSPAALAAGASGAALALAKTVDMAADLGVEIGKFSDATGVSYEQASRLIEVSGDLGISTEALQGVFNKLNKAIDPTVFAEYGIEIATARDGTTDANQTFLNAVDALHGMTDASDRAKAGAKLFGKGWTEVAELVGLGSTEITKRLKDVSDAKVFDRAKVEQARQFRAMLDDLKDVGEDLALKIGKDLLPTVVALGKTAAFAAKGVGLLTDAAEGLAGTGGPFSGTEMHDFAMQTEDLGNAFYESAYAIKNHVSNLEDLLVAMRLGTISSDDLTSAIDDARRVEEAATKARDLHALATEDHADKVRNLNAVLDANKQALKDDADATKRADKATKDLAKSVADLNDIQLDSIGQKLDAFRANLQLTESQTKLNDTLKDEKATTEDQAAAALDMAEAVADAAAATQLMNGHTQTATERNGSMVMSLTALRDSLDPKSPLRKYLDQYIATLLRIPTNIATSLSITGAGQGTANRPSPGAGRGPDGERSLTINVNAGLIADKESVGRHITEAIQREYKNGTRYPWMGGN